MASEANNEGGGGLSEGQKAILSDLRDPHRMRGTMRMLSRSLEDGHISLVHFPQEFLKDLPKALSDGLKLASEEGNVRGLAAIAGGFARIMKCNLEIAEAAEKSERLDAGDATENIGTASAETRAIAERLLRKAQADADGR